MTSVLDRKDGGTKYYLFSGVIRKSNRLYNFARDVTSCLVGVFCFLHGVAVIRQGDIPVYVTKTRKFFT
jgi:hypothetical protein